MTALLPASAPPPTIDHYHVGDVIGLLGDRSPLPQPAPFYLSDEHLSVHACVLGQSGSGKSKLLELTMRHLMAAGKGFALIDPHGDLSEDLLAFARHLQVAVPGYENLLGRVHYLEPSYEQVFGYDPFRFRPLSPVPPHLEENAFRAWLHRKVMSVAEVFQRKQNQSGFEGMPRLERVMTDVLTTVGTPLLAAVARAVRRGGPYRGRHLPLSDALVVLDVFHPRHEEVYRDVEPHLDNDIRSEFNRWHAMMNKPDAILRETESTLNRLRSFLSPVVKSIFADHVETIDFSTIVQNGEILLLNLRETDYFSADQANAIGGLFIHELLTTAQATPRELRKDYTLFVDEAGEFVGADIGRALGVMRKFRMRLCLAGQDLSTFRKGELDLRPKVLSQCGAVITFRQTWPDDLEILARVLGQRNLDFTKHEQVVDRPDGYEFVPMTAYAQGFTWNRGWTNAFATSRSESESHADAHAVGRTWADTWQKARGTQSALARSQTFGPNGTVLVTADQQTHGTGVTDARGGSTGGSETDTETDTVGTQVGVQATSGDSGGEGGSLTVTHSLQALARTREEWHETPSLRDLVSDQLEFFRHQLDLLGVGQAAVLIRSLHRTFLLQTLRVTEKWLPAHKFAQIEKAKQRLATIHGYLSVPSLSAPAADRRLGEHAAGTNGTAAPGDPTADGADENPYGH